MPMPYPWVKWVNGVIVTVFVICALVFVSSLRESPSQRHDREARAEHDYRYAEAMKAFAASEMQHMEKYEFREIMQEAELLAKEYPDGKKAMTAKIAGASRQAEAYDLHKKMMECCKHAKNEEALKMIEQLFSQYAGSEGAKLSEETYSRLTGKVMVYDPVYEVYKEQRR